jgi:hypothetical protein
VISKGGSAAPRCEGNASFQNPINIDSLHKEQKTMQDGEKERARTLFKLLAMSAKRVKEGKPMKPYEAALLKKVFPDTYSLLRDSTVEQITEINMKHRNDEFYGENARTMLTPEGRAWLKETLSTIKAHEEKK